MDASPKSVAQPTSSEPPTPTKKKLYPASLNFESLNILGHRRKSSSSSPKPFPTSDQSSTDISDAAQLSPTSPNGTWGVGRSKTMPRMTMRRTTSLEADLVLAPLPSEKLARMRRWILSLAVVNFDLDLGPVVDVLYPEAAMAAAERENVAFSSFPDSAIFDTGSEVHSFRIRDPAASSRFRESSSSVEEPTSDGFLYGFALFHQRKDSTSKRGYLQRSVVILSHLPYPSLFTACLAELAPMYFARGAPVLETACHNIANWPDPTPGLACELGFMGAVLSVELPLASAHHQLRQTSSLVVLPSGSSPPILASLPSEPSTKLPSSLKLFSSLLPKLWSLWEVLVLCEPVLVFAKNPRDASLAVWWLIELLRPLPLAMDFRPYFHIHDVDFDRLLGPSAAHAQLGKSTSLSAAGATQNQSTRGVLLGLTNPFFETICKGWPHIVSLGHVQAQSLSPSGENGSGGIDSLQDAKETSSSPSNGSHSKEMRRSTSGKSITSRLPSGHLRTPSHSRRASGSGGAGPGGGGGTPRGGGGAMELGPVAGFHSKHARYISKDRELLKMLESAVGKGGDEEARAVQQLRLHFARRASEVLVPLNRYFTSLISSSNPTTPVIPPSKINPSTSSLSSGPARSTLAPSPSPKPNQPSPTLAPFLPSAFMASLKQHGSPLPFRSRAKQKEFYERWLKSPAFGVWMRERDEEVRRVLSSRT